MADLKAVQSHSSMNIENLTSIPVEGSLTLKNCAHRQPPDRSTKDRGWAWVVCAGSFSVMFIVYGIHTSFGVLLVALLHHFNASKANTAWIGSISVNLLYFFSPVTSSLANRYGVRVVTIAGGLLMSVGLFLSSYATSLLFLYISYGLLLGIGTSLCATMALIVSADYFDKHLSLATGIVASGSSFGTLTVAPTLQILIQHLGWQTTLRIMGLGGIILALTGLVYRPVQRIPVHVENKKQCFDITILKNKGFVVWTLATTIAGFGYYIPHFFLVRYSEDLGIPLSRGSWLISFFGISSAIGRVLFGRASDMFRCPILLIYRTCMFFSGLASIFCPLVNSYAGLVAYVLVLGFLDGSYIGLMPIVTLDIVGLDDIAPAWGILYFCHSFTYLLGPPAAGLMYDSLNTFKPVFYLAAGPMIVGAFLTFFASPCKPDRMRTALTFHDNVTTHMVSPATQCHGVNRCPQHRRPPRIILTAPDESLIFLEKLTSL